MSNQTELALGRTGFGWPAAFIGTLFFSLMLSGCTIWLAVSDKHEKCKYVHTVTYAEKTMYGWMGIYRTEKHCGDYKRAGYDKWTIVAFSKSKPKRILTREAEIKPCESCVIRIQHHYGLENLEMKTLASNRMRVSWEGGGSSGNRSEYQDFDFYLDNSNRIIDVKRLER